METKEICAKICYYAQDHSSCEEAWGPRDSADLYSMMQHTSYTVACFISQSLDCSVEWEVVQEELCGPVMNEKQWLKVINKKIKEYSI